MVKSKGVAKELVHFTPKESEKANCSQKNVLVQGGFILSKFSFQRKIAGKEEFVKTKCPNESKTHSCM